jgi:tetratricopeptide (TPR) repeat protein
MSRPGFIIAILTALTFGGPAFATSQPEPTVASHVIWLQPSKVILQGTEMIESGETDQIIKGMALIKREMRRNLVLQDLVSARNNLCVGHLLLKEFNVALEECSSVISLRPSLWQAYNNRANANMGLGNYKAAIPDYEKAAELNPDSNTVQGNLDLARRQLPN